jgi:hypothetical protein
MPCICGHTHWATCRRCGCPEPIADDGTDGPPAAWGWITRDGYRYEATQAGEGVSL